MLIVRRNEKKVRIVDGRMQSGGSLSDYEK